MTGAVCSHVSHDTRRNPVGTKNEPAGDSAMTCDDMLRSDHRQLIKQLTKVRVVVVVGGGCREQTTRTARKLDGAGACTSLSIPPGIQESMTGKSL